MLRVLLLGLSISGDSPFFVFWGQGDRKDPSDQREDRINRCPKPRFGLRGLVGFMGGCIHRHPEERSDVGISFCMARDCHVGQSPPRNDVDSILTPSH